MSGSAAPWAELVALAERERALALAGRWEEVVEASSARVARARTLGPPPAAARGHLERLVALQAQIDASLAAARAFTLRELGGLQRGRSAVRGYGAGALAAARPALVDGRG